MTKRKLPTGMAARVVIACSLLFAPVLAQGDLIAHPGPVVRGVEPDSLEEGKPLERTLAVGEVHAYALKLSADRGVKLQLDKRGVAAVATLFAPDGKKLAIFGSAASSQGSEPIAFVAEAAGNYRIEVRTFFKPSAPGRYRITLVSVHAASVQEKLGEAKRGCQRSNWLDSDNNFLVDTALESISRCLSAVGHALGGRHPEAVRLAQDADAELGYLKSRWRWGEFVSPAYQQSLTEDFDALATSLDSPDAKGALATLQEVVRDIKVKAKHCRGSGRGLGGDVKVKVVTRREGVEVPERFVFYKRCLYKYSKMAPNRFGTLSPVSTLLPPSSYIMWAGKDDQPPALQHDPACFPVQGSEEQRIDVPSP